MFNSVIAGKFNDCSDNLSMVALSVKHDVLCNLTAMIAFEKIT